MSALLDSLLKPTADDYDRYPLRPARGWHTGVRGNANVMSLMGEDDRQSHGCWAKCVWDEKRSQN